MKTLILICTIALTFGLASAPAQESKEPKKPEPKKEEAKPAAKADAVAEPKAAGEIGFADPAKLTAKAPDAFKVKFETTKGNFTIEVTRSLAPNGADRFYNLVHSGYFKDIAFFRVVKGFMCQFGMHGDPAVMAKWGNARIPDDPVKSSNTRGTITFAMGGPNTRTTQLFINFVNNARLDGMGFPSFGKVVEGMDVVDKLNGEYGDMPQQGGTGPNPGRIASEGNAYLKKDFPNLDYIKSATILP